MKSSPTLLRNIIAGVLITGAVPAFADTVIVSNGTPSDERNGIVLGGSIDGGDIGCQTKSGDDCGNGAHPAGGFSLHVGAMVAPRLALLAEGWGMAHTQDSLTATQVLATANVRGWILPRFWLQGGVGVGRSKLSFDSGPLSASAMTSTVPAVAVAAGLELVHSSTFGLDLEVRGGSGMYRDDVRIYNAALGVGVTFF